MPEIKNTFTQGKMNKDLDERIVPNGQYRDALNIQVSTSEGSDVGTVQNILGNERVGSVVGGGWECVGSIADEKNDVLYSFIAHGNRSVIMEYSKDGAATPVLVDYYNSYLKFEQNEIITGINVIDDFLLWTDGKNEPKKINIQRCKDGTDSLAYPTKLIVDENAVSETVVTNWTEAFILTSGGQYNGGTVTLNLSNIGTANNPKIKRGDQLVEFETTSGALYPAPYAPGEIYVTNVDYDTGEVTISFSIYNGGGTSAIGNSVTFESYTLVAEEHITVIKKRPLAPLSVKINRAEVEDKTPLFEKIFPRFSYRYRYEDGEYSVFAPFTDVVFNSEYPENQDGIMYDINTAYSTHEPYNSGMRNMISSIELSGFVSSNIPKDVVQIDMLYKQENSSVIHILEVINHNDIEWNSNGQYGEKGLYTVKSENIYAAVPENQLLRPWDNVPRTALAQEVTGNRVVYGNYTQGYDLGIGADGKKISPRPISDFKLRFDDPEALHNAQNYTLSNDIVDNSTFDAGIDGWNPSNPAVTYNSTNQNVNWSGASYGTFFHYENMGGNPANANNPQGNWGPTGTTYKVSFTVSNYQSGNLRIQITNGNWTDVTADYYDAPSTGPIDIDLSSYTVGSSFVIEKEITLDTTVYNGQNHGRFWIRSGSSLGSDAFNGSIDNVIVQEKLLDDTIKTFHDGGFPSVKSQRNYQLGVVYGDKYGRETPVFTCSDSAVVVPWESNLASTPSASNSLQLKSHLGSYHPSWAEYYKFFVKETSGEYYNLVMDAMFNPTILDLTETEKHVWISFASSDRNKISKDDYIILKRKTIGEVVEQVSQENKFRVLDVQNEAPEAIKYKFLTLGSISNTTGTGILNETDTNGGIFYDTDYNPIIGTSANPLKKPKELRFKKSSWLAAGGGSIVDSFNTSTDSQWNVDTDLYISFIKTNNPDGSDNERTEKYKISNIELGDDGVYIIMLSKTITQEDSDVIESVPGVSGVIHEDITVVFEKKITKDLESFSGRFFVKILKDLFISDHLERIDALTILRNYIVNASTDAYWHADVISSTALLNNNCSVQSVPSADDTASVTLVADLTTTQTAWAALPQKTWFIDRMYMAAVQTDDSSFARYSGQGWYGGKPSTGGAREIYGYHPGSGVSQSNPSGFTNIIWDSHNRTFYPQDTTISLQDPGPNNGNLINGLEGIVTTGTNHTSATGIRRWKNNLRTEGVDNTYGSNPDKFYLHLSFLAPGYDLHNGTFKCTNAELGIRDGHDWHEKDHNLLNNLQGIHGGGVFTDVTGTYGINQPSKHVIMELQTANSDPYSDYIGYSTEGSGINNHKFKHEQQWNIGTPFIDLELIKFQDNLEVGRKFKFKNDPDNEIYTIEKVTIKKIYNHTPWRKMWKDNGSGTLVGTGDSVEEAAVAWSNSLPGYSYTGGDSGLVEDLKIKLQDFGKANNRRLTYILQLDKDPTNPSGGTYNPLDDTASIDPDSVTPAGIQFITEDYSLNAGEISQNPAIWETEPKDNVDLDIYYEAGQPYPIGINKETRELFAPIGCRVQILDFNEARNAFVSIQENVYLESWDEDNDGRQITLSPGFNKYSVDGSTILDYGEKQIRFFRPDGSYTTAKISDTFDVKHEGNYAVSFGITGGGPGMEVGLSWYNCFTFGNGVESDRIRDDFNGMTITNGVKASTSLDRPYGKEHRKNGLIYSGLYNSTTRVNNLNQFIMAEKITKDLNPTYGSIQKLFSRRISLIAFCEDRVIGITANKNALYNADGQPQLVATNAVLGDANPFVGDYGISQNPESFAKESYRAYFTDRQRGAVLRLSMDGLTPISDAGMSDWFKDEFKDDTHLNIIGSYDNYKKDYNLTFDRGEKEYGPQGNGRGDSQTITFSEDVNGWVSFKSFIPESGLSMSGDYYTFYKGKCYKHNTGNRNSFYGKTTYLDLNNDPNPITIGSEIKFLLNDSPLVIKNYNTLNYDGDDNWTCKSIITDQQGGTVNSFIEKEGKWFNYIKGDASASLDIKAFNFQGIGNANSIDYNI